MNRIVINGHSIETNGTNVSIINGKVIVDGKSLSTFSNYDVKVEIYGDCRDIDTTGNVIVNGSCNDIDCNGNVICYGGIKGDIDCNGNVSLKRK